MSRLDNTTLKIGLAGLVGLALALPPMASAQTMLCKNKKGKLVVRDAECKQKETALVETSELGVKTRGAGLHIVDSEGDDVGVVLSFGSGYSYYGYDEGGDGDESGQRAEFAAQLAAGGANPEWFLFTARTTGLDVCDDYYDYCGLVPDAQSDYAAFDQPGCTGTPHAYAYAYYGPPSTVDPFAFEPDVQADGLAAFFTRPSEIVQGQFSRLTRVRGSDCSSVGGSFVRACESKGGEDCAVCCLPPADIFAAPIRSIDLSGQGWTPPFRLE